MNKVVQKTNYKQRKKNKMINKYLVTTRNNGCNILQNLKARDDAINKK